MTELTNLVWTEKWRPKTVKDVVSQHKSLIENYLRNPLGMPSFIFASAKAGTGKTSCAKAIINELQCDALVLNASDERGIETVREKIKTFAESMSSNSDTKRCIFLDEADFCTAAAQASLRGIVEQYSDNAFFIFTCNDIGKIIEPIRSRCVIVHFDAPDKLEILQRLQYICAEESINDIAEADLTQLINLYYPDTRSMIVKLQNYKVDKTPLFSDTKEFIEIVKAIKKKDIKYIYEKVYNGSFNILEFNKFFFQLLFEKWDKLGIEKTAKISQYLASTEKNWSSGCNLELIFINNMLQIIASGILDEGKK